MKLNEVRKFVDSTIHNEIRKKIVEETEKKKKDYYHVTLDGEPIDTFESDNEAKDYVAKMKDKYTGKDLIIDKKTYQSYEEMIDNLDSYSDINKKNKKNMKKKLQEMDTNNDMEFIDMMQKLRKKGYMNEYQDDMGESDDIYTYSKEMGESDDMHEYQDDMGEEMHDMYEYQDDMGEEMHDMYEYQDDMGEGDTDLDDTFIDDMGDTSFDTADTSSDDDGFRSYEDLKNEYEASNQADMFEGGDGMCSECGSMMNEDGTCSECSTRFDEGSDFSQMNESRKRKIKLTESQLSNMIKKIIMESVPGMNVTKRAQSGSKKSNDDYYSSVGKKMKKREGFKGNDNPEFPHQIGSKTKKMARVNTPKEDDVVAKNKAGLQNLDYDTEPSAMFKDRAKKSLEGHSTMGNAPYTQKAKKETSNFIKTETPKKISKQVKMRDADKKERVIYKKEKVPVSTKDKKLDESIQNKELLSEMVKIKKLYGYNDKTQ